VKDSHVFEFGEQFAPLPETAGEPVAVPAAAAPPSVELNSKPQVATALQPMSTQQLVRDLKRRLRYVESEIKARKHLEKERDQIRRLLKAAKLEQATVHAIKRAAG